MIKRKKITAKENPAALRSLSLLLRALPELYPRDLTSAGVTLAFLPREGKFYFSACRYDGRMGEGKQVLFSLRSENLEELISEAGRMLIAQTENVQKFLKIRRRAK